MTVRPTLWRPAVVIPASVLVGLFVAAAVFLHGGVALLVALPMLCLIGWARMHGVRLEITADAVHARQGAFLRNEQVARSQIRAIHYYPDVISYRGPDGRPVMRTRCEWSLKQMIAVAAELRVPVYDNRRCLTLLPAKTGQLVYDPFDDRSAR